MVAVLRLVGSAYDNICRALDRFPRLVALFVAGWIAVVLIVLARAKLFWHDEIYTILLAQRSFADIWQACIEGVDLIPPLNTFLTHIIHSTVGVGHVATRLPAILGFTTAAVVVFTVVRRRSTIVVGISAAFLATLWGAWLYGYEARGYGVASGWFSLALFGWLEAAVGRRVGRNLLIMAAALAAGMWTHYYFLLAYLPIVVGEATRQLVRRQFDKMPWCAIVGSGVVALPLAFFAAAAMSQKQSFWARPLELEFAPAYHLVLARIESANPLMIGRVLIALALIEIARRAMYRNWPRRLAPHEIACGVVCLSLPAIGALVGYSSGIFHERYVIFSAIGFAIAIPLAVWCMTPSNGIGDLLLCFVVLHGFGNMTQHALRDTQPSPVWLQFRPAMLQALEEPGPLVVNGGTDYLPLWYYAPQEQQPRILYLADPQSQLREIGTDTIDRGYLGLSRWSPLPVIPLASFVQTHDSFHMFSLRSDWIESSLVRHGALFKEIGRDLPGTLYDVRNR